jgi:hypothetical protein
MAYFPHYMTLWYTHGPACGATNVAAKKAEDARAAAGLAIAKVAADLAANLQTASSLYAKTDVEQKDILDEQMQS